MTLGSTVLAAGEVCKVRHISPTILHCEVTEGSERREVGETLIVTMKDIDGVPLSHNRVEALGWKLVAYDFGFQQGHLMVVRETDEGLFSVRTKQLELICTVGHVHELEALGKILFSV